MVANPDVYCEQARKYTAEYYHELLLVYVDRLLCFSHKPQLIIDVLDFMYDLKDGLVGPPKIYLGDYIKKYQVRSGKSYWSMSSIQYVKNAIKKLERMLNDEDR